jgi:hypothetical protein
MSLSNRKARSYLINLVVERIERKCCPQGLNVVAEELRWMGMTSITSEQLRSAVRHDKTSPHPKLKSVAQDIYWLSDRNLPVGWSLYLDLRMLPCFYRLYPPQISWDDLDNPGNILPYRIANPTVNHSNYARSETSKLDPSKSYGQE